MIDLLQIVDTANKVIHTVVAGDTNGQADIFVKDLTTGAITRVNTAADGSQTNASSLPICHYSRFNAGSGFLLSGS